MSAPANPDYRCHAIVRGVDESLVRLRADGDGWMGIDEDGIVTRWSGGGEVTAEVEIEEALPLRDGVPLPGGRTLLCGRSAVLLLDPEGEVERRSSLPAEVTAQALAIDPQGRWGVVAADDGKVRVLQLPDLTPLAELGAGERNAGVTFHPDGATFAVSASWQGGSQLIFGRLDPRGRLVTAPEPLELETDTLGAAAFSPDGRWLAVPTRELRLFAFPSRAIACAFGPDGQRVPVPDTPTVLERVWSGAAFTADGTLMAAPPEGEEVLLFAALPGPGATALVHPRGANLVATGPGGLAVAGADLTLRLWRR